MAISEKNIPQILATLGQLWGHKNTFTQILCVSCTRFFLLPGDENLPPKKTIADKLHTLGPTTFCPSHVFVVLSSCKVSPSIISH
jgi:hypothetical protein